MTEDIYLNYNGKLISSDEHIISSANRAFRYGDSLFETIRVVQGRMLFINAHIARLTRGMKVLKMTVPSFFSADYFINEINKILVKNHTDTDARIRLTVFRNDGGFYTPETNDISFLIEAQPILDAGYSVNIKGYTIDVFQDYRKADNILSTIKSGNAIINVLAGIYKKQMGLDDCVIMNEKGNIAEAINSNIFVVKNGALYTPSLDESCVDGIMRQQILHIAKENRISIYEISLPLNVLLNADEVFLTNAISGIKWVVAYKGKRYFNNMAKMLTEKLNQRVSSYIESFSIHE